MGTFKDEDIFNTISRDMKDTSPGGDKIGDDDFAVPTMPTFKYTLSEEEIWGIVGYVRSLHGKKLVLDGLLPAGGHPQLGAAEHAPGTRPLRYHPVAVVKDRRGDYPQYPPGENLAVQLLPAAVIVLGGLQAAGNCLIAEKSDPESAAIHYPEDRCFRKPENDLNPILPKD